MTARLQKISEAILADDEATLASLLASLPTRRRPEDVLWKIADLQQSVALHRRALEADRFDNMPCHANA